MNQFWSLLPSVEKLQEQAVTAASKAQNLAKEFVEKTQDAATSAASNARQLTRKVADDARGLTEEGGWKVAASKAKEQLKKAMQFTDPFTTTQPDIETPPEVLEAFGITPEFKEFIRNLDYSTFRDFSDTELNVSVGFVLDDEGVLRLNPWQEKHVLLMLRVSKELDHLRYLLCPKRMSEEKFWLVYFSLTHTHLPVGCKSGIIPELHETEQHSIPEIGRIKEETAPKKEVEIEDKESEEDDLDKYLNDVLDEGSNREHSTSESFDNLDDFMDELNSQGSNDVLELQSKEPKETNEEMEEQMDPSNA